MKERFLAVFSAIVFTSALSSFCYGDEFHFNKLFIGERPSGMAGAYTALSDDAPGLFFNPAGIVFGENEASTSLNAYVVSQTTYSNVIGDHDWTRKTGELTPGFLGFTYDLPKGKVGVSVVMTDSELVEQEFELDDVKLDGITWFRHADIHYNFEYRVYNIGPTYSIDISDTVSIGTTVYVHYKDKEEILQQKFEYDMFGEYELTTVNTEETEWGVKPILGFMYRSKDQSISFGATISRIFVIKREYAYDYTWIYYEPYGDEDCPEHYLYDPLNISEDSARKRDYPYVLSLGAAYAFSPTFLVSVNVTGYTETDRKDDNETPSTFATKQFFNTSIGIEYAFLPQWILRAGFYTDLANNDLDDVRFDEHREAIDMYGGSLSMTYEKDKKQYSLGLSLVHGEGSAALGDIGFGEHRNTEDTVDARKYGVRLFMSLSM